MYLTGAQGASSLTSGLDIAATTRGVIAGVGPIVAKLRSGAASGFRKVRSTTIDGVRPTNTTLPPAAAKARKRSSIFFWITVQEGIIIVLYIWPLRFFIPLPSSVQTSINESASI